MKHILLFAMLLLAVVSAEAQKKKPKSHKAPKPPVVEEMPPPIPLTSFGNADYSDVVVDNTPNYDRKPTLEDQNRCFDAYFEKDSLKRENLLRELKLYETAENALQEYLDGYNRRFDNGQPFFKIEHFKHNCNLLSKNPMGGMETLFKVEFTFDREKYLKECAAQGRTKDLLIPCNFTVYADPIYRSIEGRNPFSSNCVQERL